MYKGWSFLLSSIKKQAISAISMMCMEGRANPLYCVKQIFLCDSNNKGKELFFSFLCAPSTQYMSEALTAMSNHSNLAFFANSSITTTTTTRQHHDRDRTTLITTTVPFSSNITDNQLRHLLITSSRTSQHSATVIAATTTTESIEEFPDHHFKVNSIIDNLHAPCDRARVTNTMISLLPSSGKKRTCSFFFLSSCFIFPQRFQVIFLFASFYFPFF